MLVAVPIDPRAQGSLVDTQLAGDFGGRSLGLDHHLHRLFTVFRSELTIFRHNDPSSSGDILPYWVTVRWEPHTSVMRSLIRLMSLRCRSVSESQPRPVASAARAVASSRCWVRTGMWSLVVWKLGP